MFPESLKIKETEIKFRDRRASSYEDIYLETFGRYWNSVEMNTVFKYLKPGPEDIILDAGGGTGRLSVGLSKMSRMVISVDFSPRSANILNQKNSIQNINNVFSVACDLHDLGLGKECVDKAVSVQVFQHIAFKKERLRALCEIYNSLKKGGIFVLSVYNWKPAYAFRFSQKEQYQEIGHDEGLYCYKFTPDELFKLLHEAGFRDIKVRGIVNIPSRIARQKWLLESMGCFDIWLSNFDFSKEIGVYLIGICRK